MEQVDPAAVTMLDQSPDQLRRARRKPQLAGCTKVLGDAERLPFATTRSTATSLAGASSTGPTPRAPRRRPIAWCARRDRVDRRPPATALAGPAGGRGLDALSHGGPVPRLVRGGGLRGDRDLRLAAPWGQGDGDPAGDRRRAFAGRAAGGARRHSRGRARALDAPPAGPLLAGRWPAPRSCRWGSSCTCAPGEPAATDDVGYGGRPAVRLTAPWLAAAITPWRFSRPHTLVGTTLSVPDPRDRGR